MCWDHSLKGRLNTLRLERWSQVEIFLLPWHFGLWTACQDKHRIMVQKNWCLSVGRMWGPLRVCLKHSSPWVLVSCLVFLLEWGSPVSRDASSFLGIVRSSFHLSQNIKHSCQQCQLLNHLLPRKDWYSECMCCRGHPHRLQDPSNAIILGLLWLLATDSSQLRPLSRQYPHLFPRVAHFWEARWGSNEARCLPAQQQMESLSHSHFLWQSPSTKHPSSSFTLSNSASCGWYWNVP